MAACERTETVAALLLKEAREPRGISWTTAWALQDFFGVHEDSKWTLRSALDHCMQSQRPSPFVEYDFHDHVLHVRNGCMLTRDVKLKPIPE